MLDEEKEKLFERKSEYLSIGITKSGSRVGVIPIPWEITAHAYNMRTPDVYISPEDLNDRAIWEKINSFKVLGLYIWESLETYDFIADLIDLQDIYIMNAKHLQGLDFLEKTKECRMLFLQDVELDTLEKLVLANNQKDNLFGRLNCVALYNCDVKDISVFETEEHYFSEFLVWLPHGSNKKRWGIIKAGKRRVYECD